MKRKYWALGFTLIELMIAVGIVGIVSAMAFSGTEIYQRKRNRTEGADLMRRIATAQTCYRNKMGQYGTLASLATCDPSLPTTAGTNSRFRVTVVPAAAGSYLGYDAAVELFDEKFRQLDPNCVRYETSVLGPLTKQISRSNDGAETNGCYGR